MSESDNNIFLNLLKVYNINELQKELDKYKEISNI